MSPETEEQPAYLSDSRVQGYLQALNERPASTEGYLAENFEKCSSEDGENRSALLLATVAFLSERNRKSATARCVPCFSQAQSSELQEAGGPASNLSTLAEAVAAMIDPHTFPSRTLLLAADASARGAILPVLLKLLQGIATCERVYMLNGTSTITPPNSNEKCTQQTIQSQDSMQDDRRVSSMSGAEIVESFILTCIGRDDGPCSAHVKGGGVFGITLLREVPMSDAVLLKAVRVVLARLSSYRDPTDLDEAPSLIYNLLLLTSNTSAGRKVACEMKRSVLYSIIFYFIRLDSVMQPTSESFDEFDDDEVISSAALTRPTLTKLRQIQGTVLLYFDFAARQDPTLFSEIIKLAKTEVCAPLNILTPFGCAVILVMARSPAYSLKAIEGLLTCVQKYRQEMLRRERTKFSRLVSEAFTVPACPEKSILSAVEASGSGWDYVAEPGLSFALAFLDETAKSANQSTPVAFERSLAFLKAIIDLLFHHHPSLRGEVVEQLLSRIVLHESSAQLSIDILRELANKRTMFVVEQAVHFKESLDDLITLPAHVAAQLIVALLPVFETKPDLHDYCFIALRKALVRREARPRSVAALGFLEMLIHGSGNATGPSLDASGFLRRTLSHQAIVRRAFYQYTRRQIVDKRIPATVAQCLLGVLRPHLQDFVSLKDEPFLVIPRCLSNVSDDICEDLAELILIVDALETSTLTTCNNSSMLQLALNVAKMPLDRFDIDKEADFKHCAKDRNIAMVLADVLKSLSGVLFANAQSLTEEQVLDDLAPMLERRQQLVSSLKESGINESCFDSRSSKERSRAKNAKAGLVDKQDKENIGPADGSREMIAELSSSLYMRESCPLECLAAAIATITAKHSAPTEKVLLLWTSLLCEIRDILGRRSLTGDGPRHLLVCVSSMLPHIMTVFRNARAAAKSTKQTTACMQLALEVGEACFASIWQCSPSDIEAFGILCSALLDRSNEGMTAESAWEASESALESLSSSLLDDGAYRESCASLKFLTTLQSFAAGCVGSGQKHLHERLSKRMSWAREMLLTRVIADSGTLKAMAILALEESDTDVVGPLGCSIYKALGDLSEEESGQWTPMPSAQEISKESVQIVLPVLCRGIELALEEAEWALRQAIRLSEAEMTSQLESPDNQRSFRQMAIMTEAHSFLLVEQLVLSMSRLCRARLQKWSQVESVLKVVSRVYKFLSFAVRLQISRKEQLGKAFQSLVENVGRHLTPGIYAQMTFASDPKSFQESKQKIVKESRLMPSLIGNLEEYEILLLKLSKQLGEFKVPFLKGMKRSTARDFKIDLRNLEAQPNSDSEGGSQASRRKRPKGSG